MAMTMTGEVTLPAERYRADAPGGTILRYDVTANVGGRIAQMGSRLIDGVPKKMADQFFSNFASAMDDKRAS
jgi:uncharacterized protein